MNSIRIKLTKENYKKYSKLTAILQTLTEIQKDYWDRLTVMYREEKEKKRGVKHKESENCKSWS